MIQHSVIFKLRYRTYSIEEKDFLNAARQLALIPGVQDFQCLRQISPKNHFTFGLSMKFSDQEAYDHYNNHIDHTRFVDVYWRRGVADFLEIDFTELP
jgi:hypothetical protein